jgi:O-antigen/teichoic acid export membrane protein
VWRRSATLASNAGLLLTGVVSSVVISRLLGPEGRGAYVEWQAWAAAIGIIAAAGLPQVVVLDDWNPTRHRLGDLVPPLAVTALCGGVLTVVAGVWLLGAEMSLVGMVLVTWATQAGAVATGEAQRGGRMTGEFNLVRMLPQVAALAAITALALVGNRSAAHWLSAIAGAQAVVLVMSLIWVTRPLRVRPSSRSSLRRTFAASARLGPGNWVTLVQYRADLLIVALMFPPVQVGYYAVGVAAQTAVAAAGQTGGQYWFARSHAGDPANPPSLRKELVQTAALACAVAVVIAVSAPWWIPGLYGPDFEPALPLVVGLCVLAVVQSLDYLLAHEALLIGAGSRVALYRLPALMLVLIGFSFVYSLDLEPLWVVACSALGYSVSGGVLARVASRRRVADRSHLE